MLFEKYWQHQPLNGQAERQPFAGVALSLPAYSPAFNSSENAFAKLKAPLCSAAARTVQDRWAAIREALTRFKPDQCRNDLAATGYDAYDPT